MKGAPKQGELVIATIKKIFPYGAFCTLDEYDDLEAFLHVSEIAPRWIKNIHEHIKEGQKVIAKVHRYLPEKKQIDLSIKRVSDSDRVWKREQYRRSRRAEKMLELAARKLRRSRAKFVESTWKVLEDAYGSAYAALDALSLDTETARKKLKLPARTLEVLEKIAKENIRKQKVSISRTVKLECFESDGVKRIMDAFGSLKSSKVNLSVKYLGAPIYRIDITADDYKTAEREFSRLMSEIEEKMGKCRYRIEVVGGDE
ncbi:translation initiation factor IF-2 subunit alpha [Candidatus Pacearchaeota archaeon]|nr:MAG: translation initiation factor IF-2 subunit alpha [Candidatus Pacearchaeota archaeon]